MIPQRPKQPKAGTGLRQNANRIATGVDLKMVYELKGPESQYRQTLPNCTIEAKLSGTIAIENTMHNRYEHNLELSLKNSGIEAKPNLRAFGDQAFRDLTQEVSIGYNDGRVTVQAPIMYKAGLAPYTIQVQAENPTTLKGTLKLDTISATTTMGRKRYKYTADIQFDVTVTMHPMTNKGPEMARERMPQRHPAATEKSLISEKYADYLPQFLVSITIIVLSLFAWQSRLIPPMQSTTTGPFLHTIPMDQPGMI